MFARAFEPWHLVVLAIVFALLFSAKRLPDGARALGRSVRILKSEMKAARKDGADVNSATPRASTTE